MDFAKVKGITLPEGNAAQITNGAGNVLWTAGLPSIYQQVEYIRADANVGAYIDLGFAFDTGATVEMSQWILDTATAYPFGAAENSGRWRCCVSSPYGGNAAYCYGSNSTTYISALAVHSLGKENHFIFNWEKGNLSVRNLTAATSKANTDQIEYTMTSHLYLFAQNYNGTARFGDIRQIGYFRYYDKNGDLICDLVPCRRRSDSVIGMYDLVRGIFLTNAGSGTFTAGGDL